MIVTHCKYSGLPLAIVPTFDGMSIKAISEHPVFALPVKKLIDIAGSVKVTQITKNERILMGLALVKSTGLVSFHTRLNVRDGAHEATKAAVFMQAARSFAKVYQDLLSAPKQIACMVNQLPMFRVSEDTKLDEITNWCKISLVKASAYISVGRESRLRDESYGLAMNFLDDDGTKLSRGRAKIVNSQYSLPQLYDADIGVWAYDMLCENFSDEVINEQSAKFQACYNLLTLTGSTPKASAIANLRDTLDSILPLDTPTHERRKQLVIAYLDKKHSELVARTAALLGEEVSTELRQVGNKQWSYVVLAPVGAAGLVSGGLGASIAPNGLASVKGGAGGFAARGSATLDTASQGASIAPTAPKTAAASATTSQMVASLRAKMQRKGMMK